MTVLITIINGVRVEATSIKTGVYGSTLKPIDNKEWIGHVPLSHVPEHIKQKCLFFIP